MLERTQMSSFNLHLTGIIKLFPARESLVSDIPAVDRKAANLFLQCIICMHVLPTEKQEGFIHKEL